MRLLVSGLALALAILASAALPSLGFASPSSDYEIHDTTGKVIGRFYTLGASAPDVIPQGFPITDEEGIAFWRDYQALGGPGVLGYPISQRFVWHGYVTQVTQRAVLQWRPEIGRTQLVNLLNLLSSAGKDDWLDTQGVPRPTVGYPPLNNQEDWARAKRETESLLSQAPAIKEFYYSAVDPLTLYGLPTSPVIDRGDFLVIRMQRGVLQQWKRDYPWALAGQATAANVGTLLRDSGILPKTVFQPIAADNHAPLVPPADAIQGKATWYGQPFHGRTMYNGQVYDMYDPTTTAANIFPIGTWLRVWNLSNNRWIEVQVRDRGGFREPLILDLSYAAFQELDPGRSGMIDVAVEVIPGP